MITTLYIKLADGVTGFTNERLNLNLSTPNKIAASLDYANISEEVFAALQSGDIVQISDTEYQNIINSSSTSTTSISTAELLTLASFLPSDLIDGDVFFVERGTEFFKVGWDTLRAILLSISAKVNLVFRPGDTKVGWTLPAIGGTTLQSDFLIGKDIRVEVQGMGLPLSDTHDIKTDDYQYNKTTGTVTRIGTFKDGEVIGIYQVN